jgi:hypothetical protein
MLSLLFSQFNIVGIVAADKTSPVLKSSVPKNSQTGISIESKITLNFSENIYKGINFAKIKLTKSGKAVKIKCSISKNTVHIAHSSKFSYSTNYVLTIPTKSVKDKSGNMLKKTSVIKFKTKKVPSKPTPIPTTTPTPTLKPSPSPSPTPIQTPLDGVVVANDSDLSLALANQSLKTIVFNPGYTFNGFTVKYPVYIIGNGAAVSSKITISANNVTIDNINSTAATIATDPDYNVVYQISLNKTGINIKNGSIRGTLNKYTAKGIVCPGSVTSQINIENVDFVDLRFGIVLGNGLRGAVLSLKNSTFSNVDNAIGWTEGCTIAEIKGNIFNAGVEGIGLGDGIIVTIPGQDIWSLRNYLQRVNLFYGYIDYKNVADYRRLSPTPMGHKTPTPAPTPKPTPKQLTTPTPKPISTPSDTYKVIAKINKLAVDSPDKKAHILFLGSSLTSNGNIPQVLSFFLKQLNLPVTISQFTPGGNSLYNIFTTLQYPSQSEITKNKDIVILQGYKTFDFYSTLKLKELFDADTEFYYLMSEYDVNDLFISQITDYANDGGKMKYIPSGYAYKSFIDETEFTYQQLILADLIHPTTLYGYLAACTAYSRIFGVTCVGLPYSFLDKETQAQIPGNNKIEKDAKIHVAQETIMDVMKIALPPG